MARWELCRIEVVVRDQKGFMNSRRFTKYIVVADTMQGRTIIDETPEWENPPTDTFSQQHYDAVQQQESLLRGRLLAQGWEPINSEKGRVTVFRRQVP